jgi:hypothetical protein
MAGCGREYNGGYKVSGTPLHCGVNLYWKIAGGDHRVREQEVHLCEACTKAAETIS